MAELLLHVALATSAEEARPARKEWPENLLSRSPSVRSPRTPAAMAVCLTSRRGGRSRMARPVSPKAVPAFERLPASRRVQRKRGDVIAPWIEDSGSAVLQILRVARNQIEVGLDRRRRKQGIDDGRRMTRFAFHTARDGPPATDDGVAERQNS